MEESLAGVATVERVVLESRRQDDLREAEAVRVNGLFERIEANLASEVRQIRELLTISSKSVEIANNRAELAASSLSERIGLSTITLSKLISDVQSDISTGVDEISKQYDERLQPIEAANEQAEGRNKLTFTTIHMVVVALLALSVGILEHILFK